MIGGIIICHAQLAFELLNTVNKLLGKAEGIYPFSSDFLAPETLYNQIMEQIKAKEISDMVVMVDLRGGNCWKVGKMLSREIPSMKLLSGVNIPMLVSFLNKRDKLSFQELTETIEKDTNRGIVLE